MSLLSAWSRKMIILMSRLMRVGATSSSDVTAPTAPTITATETSSSAISIALTAAATDAVGVTGYELDWSPNGSSSWTNLPGVTVAGSFPYSHTGLSASTAYYYRSRARDAAGNWGNYGISNATTDASSGTVIFNPGDLGGYSSDNDIFTVDTNSYGGSASLLQNTITRPGGSSKALRISYPADDAGTELIFPAFAATTSLYYRWYMMLDSNWSGHFPVGLKITRTFTEADWTAVVGEPGIDGEAYSSPKLWMKYADPDTGFNPEYPIGGDPNGTQVWGTCTGTMNLDIGAAFLNETLFDNGLSHVRAGVWYLYEIYQEMNSADGVGDGKLHIRIDRQPVYTNNAVKWVDSTRYVVYGINGWRSMWFGGNASYGDFTFPTGTTLYRYEDGYFVSTDAQWL